ncbi:MAG: hypothetical protein QG671_931 [Actinomycetota bacterium]|nr:hypothetical protein [Actinomycetota bacterium]
MSRYVALHAIIHFATPRITSHVRERGSGIHRPDGAGIRVFPAAPWPQYKMRPILVTQRASSILMKIFPPDVELTLAGASQLPSRTGFSECRRWSTA